MTINIDIHSYGASHSHSMDTSDKGAVLRSYLADADLVGLASYPGTADIDIVTSRGAILTSCKARCDVAAPSCVAKERINTVARVDAAGCVVLERTRTVGRVEPAGCVAEERLITVGRVAAAGCVVKERKNTVSHVVAAGCVVFERAGTV